MHISISGYNLLNVVCAVLWIVNFLPAVRKLCREKTGCSGKDANGVHIKITRKERRRAGTMFPVNHLGVNTFNIEVMNSSSYQCISFPLNGTFSKRQ